MTQRTGIPAGRTVFAVTWIPVLAYGAVLTMPAFLAVLGKSYGMSSSELGSLASAEWFACIAGTYFANSRSIGDLTRWVLWACALAVVVNLAGVALAGKLALIYFHPLSTFGAGIAYGYALKVFDASRRQQRNYGVFLAVVNVSELAIFQLINYLTVAYSKAAVFVVYAGLAFGAVLVTSAVRKPLARLGGTEAGTASFAATGLRRPRPIVLFSVVALGVSYAAFGMMWPFVQLMGGARGLSPLEVTNGTSAYSITGIMGALAAAVLPSRINRSAVLSLALIALFASVYMLYVATGFTWFLAGCSIFGFYWTFYCTSHVSLIAQADSTGRAIVFCGMAPSLGAIAGSFWGGRLIEGTNYLPTAEVGLVVAAVGIAATLYALAQKQPPDESGSLVAAPRGQAGG